MLSAQHEMAASENTPLAMPVEALESQRKVLEQLHYLTTFRNQMVVVAGPEGAGKSTLLEVFLEQASDYANLAYLNTPQKLTVEQIRQRILQQITSVMRMPEDISLSKSIRRALPSQPQHLMIVVDDAEHLPPVILDELQELVLHSRFTAGRHRISVIISGKTEWAARQKKRLPSNQNDAPEIVVIPEFTDSEALQFAKRLLSGHAKGKALAADNYRIQAALGTSLSYPGVIRDSLQNLVAPIEKTRYHIEDTPEQETAKPQKRKTAQSSAPVKEGTPMRLKLAMVATLMITVAVSGWMYRDDIMATYQELTQVRNEVKSESGTESPLPATESNATQTTDLTSPVQPEDWLNPVLEQGESQLTMSYQEALPRLASAAREYQQEGDFDIGLYQVRSFNPLVAAATAALENNAVSEASETSEPAELASTESAEPEVPNQEAEVATTQEPDATPEPVNAWLNAQDNPIILNMDASRVGLQLAAFSQEQATMQFVEAQANQNNLMVYHTLRNGGDWYVVVTGNYASLAEARNAISTLPANQQALQPWAKPFEWMHRELAVVGLSPQN
ncbi:MULTISPECIES: AAA family ATPase [Gammaproteobacteria]|uniref:AAA family ATPase n=1 Tax=Gammaproteobacteria TaxID=1236 RepID=UPI000DD0279F|nr:MULTISPECIES: AAA family ATPase [Gammaproteobacteria]RTE85920.1 hypothetical protein DQX04_10775 [Aliidiomarina sp. B3213]TCZ90081.1 hypothetical protein EYQ95_09690 [Lysobacter sp. N42]